MSKKNRKKVKLSSRPVSLPANSATPAKKLKVGAMDIFRATQDAARNVLAKEARSVSTADGFENFIARVGLHTDNPLSDSTYDFNLITRNRILLEAAYRGSWIAGVMIDSYADDMTRAGIDITTSDESDLRVLFQDFTRLQIWQSLNADIKWGRLYGGAIAVMQIEGQNLATPLDVSTVSKGQFKGLVVFDRWQLNPVLSPVIQSGPNMGLPMYYQIVNDPRSYDPEAPTATGQTTVHYTRCVRFTGIDLPYFQAITEMMWGESFLERLWDRLIAFDNASLSSGQLIDRANLRTVGIEGLREIIAAGGEAQAGLEGQFDLMRAAQVNEGLTLIDKNDTFQSTAYSFAGLSDMMLQKLQELSGASGIPLVRLLGQSPAGLGNTGETDLRMYYDSINAAQNSKLRDPMDTLLRVMWRSSFGQPAPQDLEFTFKSLWQTDAKDKAEIAKTNTETILSAHEGGLVSTPTAMKELRSISGDTGLFSDISNEDIEEAELEPPPMPDEAPAESAEKPDNEKKPAKAQDGFKGFFGKMFSRK